ncbi:MAG TPA: oxygenase MpaB family protein [Verrucomicrobiae bacterium]|nr:oxygenase MpaB family protein [Verrucomicrobiae bacterium]
MHGSLLSAHDLTRLRTACGRETVDPARSLFGPESVTWRVNREAVLLLGGGRALLLQVAHPLVAAGVAAHSEFRAHPLRRLWRTLDLMLTLAFADGATALAAVRTIEAVHARVHGVLEEPSGPFPRGTRYDANDPALLLWVYATLVDTALVVYERFVAPLGVEGRAAYYEGSKVGGRLLGIPEAIMPPTFARFQEYVDDMIRGDALAVGPAGREIAASILRPVVPLGLAQAFRAADLFTVGLLPPPIRERYGLSWSAGQERALHALMTLARRVLPFVPRRVRLMPHARRAGVAAEAVRQTHYRG